MEMGRMFHWGSTAMLTAPRDARFRAAPQKLTVYRAPFRTVILWLVEPKTWGVLPELLTRYRAVEADELGGRFPPRFTTVARESAFREFHQIPKLEYRPVPQAFPLVN